MGKIVAIGGGSIGNATRTATTTGIDQEVVRLSGKANPKLLFIPTASSDDTEYCTNLKNQFGSALGCTVEVLHLIKKSWLPHELESMILNADIIYVGGGNTLMMMKRWRKLGIDNLLRTAHKKGIVLCGLSAGSICWFKYGNSDSRKYKNPNADLIKVRGLNLIPTLHCPHYHSESDRKASLKNMMRKTTGIAIAIDDCCALQIVDESYRILSTKPTANAYKVYWKRGEFYEEQLTKTTDWLPIALLLKK